MPDADRRRAVRVLIADDHEVVRVGLRTVLEDEADLEVVGEASDGHEALALAERLEPDVVLLDLRMPGPSGAETIVALGKCCPHTAVLMLTSFDGDEDIYRA